MAEYTRLSEMLRVMVECKNVRSEKLAKYLDNLIDGLKFGYKTTWFMTCLT